MDYKKLFEDIDILSESKVEDEIKKLIKGDGKFLKFKKLAKKSADNVPDFLEYVYSTYRKDIDKLSTKYDIDYNDLGQLFISM